MREGMTVLKLDKYEIGLIINALNDLRNGLIQKNDYTDAVDELLIKISNAPSKKKCLVRSL